jgi:hypothetical protein
MDEDMLGGVTLLTQKQKLRKKVKVYKKYELITSHSCRSFVSNHIGKRLIQNFVWWMVNRRMMLHYDNSTSKENK